MDYGKAIAELDVLREFSPREPSGSEGRSEMGNRHADLLIYEVSWSIIVFLFARWDEDIRPRIADIRGVKPNEVTLDELGDLRILRKCIVHNAGKLKTADYARLKTMQGLFAPDEVITPSHDDMHKVFVLMKQSIARLILKYTGDLRNAPKPEKIVGIAIQKA